MREYLINIRPHHMLCLQFFEGKGYSKEFVENMMEIKKKLDRDNPVVRLVQEADSICHNCPKRENRECDEANIIAGHDRRVLSRVEKELRVLSQSDKEIVCNWNEIVELIHRNIIDAKKIKEVCVQCQWSDICFKKEK